MHTEEMQTLNFDGKGIMGQAFYLQMTSALT